MTNSQECATAGVESIVVYKSDLISELQEAQHILRELVRDSRCCICWDVLQKTYVGQCGHGMCMKCASSMFLSLSGVLQATVCPTCKQLITHFDVGKNPSDITHSYTLDHIYEPLRLWAAKNMDVETEELTRRPEIVPRRLEIPRNAQDENEREYEEPMEPFTCVFLFLMIIAFGLLSLKQSYDG